MIKPKPRRKDAAGPARGAASAARKREAGGMAVHAVIGPEAAAQLTELLPAYASKTAVLEAAIALLHAQR